jgi:pimeloyl-ACP methyl ester carboxylesterase
MKEEKNLFGQGNVIINYDFNGQENQVKIFYRFLTGQKLVDQNTKVILILHGWASLGAKSWEPVLNLIQPDLKNYNYLVLVPDMAGFGQSQPLQNKQQDQVMGAENYADLIWLFLKQSTIKADPSILNLTIVGHSFGGAVGAILCAKYLQNSQKAKLILIAPAIVRKPKNETSKVEKTTKIGAKVMKMPVLNVGYSLTRKIWYRFFGSADYLKTSGVMQKVMQRVISEDLQNWLPKITTSVVLVWGDKDSHTPIQDAKLVQKGLKKCEYIQLSEMTHGVHIKEPKLICDLILKQALS